MNLFQRLLAGASFVASKERLEQCDYSIHELLFVQRGCVKLGNRATISEVAFPVIARQKTTTTYTK